LGSRVVVTGAAGHVGGNLVRALLAQKRQVRVLVHEDTRALEGLDVERVPGDVRDLDSLRTTFDGAATVFHLAAQISITGDQGGRVWAVHDRVHHAVRHRDAQRPDDGAAHTSWPGRRAPRTPLKPCAGARPSGCPPS